MRRRWRRRRGPLSARLFAWFLSAIVLAVVSSALTFHYFTPEPDAPAAVVSRTVETRLVRTWDDPHARDAYIAQLRDTTGLDLVLRTDPNVLPSRLQHRRGRGVVLEANSVFIPIYRGNELLGALEYRSQNNTHRAWYFIVLPLLVAFTTLGVGARRVAKRLSRPLEDVARAAEQFGAGDLTARARVDEGSRHFVSDEVRELGAAFDAMADRIERVVVDQRELLAAISHELRSPLARARVALEISSERAEDGDRKRLADIDGELVRVDAILTDLLASARAGLSDLRRAPVALDALVSRVAAGESPAPTVEIADDVAGAKLSLDEALVARAVANVIINARNYAGDAAHVTARVERRGTDLAVVVTDDGPGFPTDVLPRAFEPFVRGDAARTPTASKSTGLGLALVRRIVEAHGGTAVAKNLPIGAEVTLTFPEVVS